MGGRGGQGEERSRKSWGTERGWRGGRAVVDGGTVMAGAGEGESGKGKVRKSKRGRLGGF